MHHVIEPCLHGQQLLTKGGEESQSKQIFEKTTKSERGTTFIVIGGCTRYIGEKNTLMYLEGFLCMVNDEILKFKPRGVNG
jgi:hypothetical protein